MRDVGEGTVPGSGICADVGHIVLWFFYPFLLSGIDDSAVMVHMGTPAYTRHGLRFLLQSKLAAVALGATA